MTKACTRADLIQAGEQGNHFQVSTLPPLQTPRCYTVDADIYATAMADILVIRSDIDGVIIDLDKDGDERTG